MEGRMIHYHGTPITPEASTAQILARRYAMVSFAHPDQIELIADACQSFALGNGAFSACRAGIPVAVWTAFYEWVKLWQQHPGFDWFFTPIGIELNLEYVSMSRKRVREDAPLLWPEVIS
jgi:hypothetical protein